VTIAIVRGLY